MPRRRSSELSARSSMDPEALTDFVLRMRAFMQAREWRGAWDVYAGRNDYNERGEFDPAAERALGAVVLLASAADFARCRREAPAPPEGVRLFFGRFFEVAPQPPEDAPGCSGCTFWFSRSSSWRPRF